MDWLPFFKWAGYFVLIAGAATTICTRVLQDKKNETSIRSIEAVIRITFTEHWGEPPYAEWSVLAQPVSIMEWTSANGQLSPITFCAKQLIFETNKHNIALFKSTVRPEPGSSVLGQVAGFLKQYNTVALRIPFSFPDRLHNPYITFIQVDVDFYINGKRAEGLHIGPWQTLNYNSPLSLKLGKNNEFFNIKR